MFPAPGKLDRATNTLDLLGRNLLSVHRVSESPEVTKESLTCTVISELLLKSSGQGLVIKQFVTCTLSDMIKPPIPGGWEFSVLGTLTPL